MNQEGVMASHADPQKRSSDSAGEALEPERASVAAGDSSVRRWWVTQSLAQVLDRTISVPFVVSWKVPADYVLNQPFKCKDYAGLLQCHLVRPPQDQSVLVTYWRSASHFRTQKAAFTAANRLDVNEWWTGELADARIHRQPLWPTSPLDALLKIAAILGALAVCYQTSVVLWSTPRVSVGVDSRQPIDAPANGVFPLRLVFTNRSLSSAEVELTAMQTNSVDADVTTSQPFFTIAAGARYEAMLNGHVGQAGDVRLRIESSTRAGRLRTRETQVTTVDVLVWPALRLGGVGTADCGLTQCVARTELSIGRRENNGFQCWAHLVGHPGVEIRAVRSAVDGGGQPTANGVGDDRITKIDWRQPPSEAFQRQSIDILLLADKPRSDWQSIVSKIKALCQPVPAVER
jgi:hypothetical protein